MPAEMMQFVSVPWSMPDKRTVDRRTVDFAEFYARFSPEQAALTASGQGQQITDHSLAADRPVHLAWACGWSKARDPARRG